MPSLTLLCAHCGCRFAAAHPAARTCSVSCRNKLYRARLLAQRQRLAAEAQAALGSGDMLKLEQVARATARLLAA